MLLKSKPFTQITHKNKVMSCFLLKCYHYYNILSALLFIYIFWVFVPLTKYTNCDLSIILLNKWEPT